MVTTSTGLAGPRRHGVRAIGAITLIAHAASRVRSGSRSRLGLCLDPWAPAVLLAVGLALLAPVTTDAAPRVIRPPEDVEGLTRVGQRVVFLGYRWRPSERMTLWTSDLTPNGTRPLVGPPGASEGRVIGFGSHAIVYAVGGARGRELWRTDGTPSGTRLLAGGSVPAIDYTFTRVGKRLFWIGPEYPGGSTRFDAYLWTSDGTPGGTRRLALLESDKLGFKDEYGGYWLQAYRRILILGTRTGGLWRSDGSESGTFHLADGRWPWVVGGRVYLSASDEQHGRELWVTDGTPGGTNMVADICAGPCDSSWWNLVPVAAGKVVFNADDGQHGAELWVTDGTNAGTRMIADVCPGPCGSGAAPIPRSKLGGRVFFTAKDATDGTELWVTDGSAQGTRQVRDICRGRCSSDPDDVSIAGGRLFFDAYDRQHGRELWVTDGSKAATRLVRDICTGRCSADPSDLTATMDDRVLFTRYVTSGSEPWLTDGTRAGTTRLQASCPGKRYCVSSGFVPIKPGSTLFEVYDGHERHPWVIEERGRKVYPLRPYDSIGGVYESLRQHGALVFSTYFGGVWRTDGTRAGTVRLTPP